jgi:hypothetical protein
MQYEHDLGAGHKIYLENQGSQTIIHNIISGPGQQQQSSSSFATGAWTATPTFHPTVNGVLIKLSTTQGEKEILIQGGNINLTGQKPLEPLAPLEMKMGNMQMTMKPMQMKMGNMQMAMDSPPQSTKNYCSQCGAKLAPGDRFCSSCGHPL